MASEQLTRSFPPSLLRVRDTRWANGDRPELVRWRSNPNDRDNVQMLTPAQPKPPAEAGGK